MTRNDALRILAPHAWRRPRDYGGFSPDGDYLIYSRHRDSSLLDNHNYETLYQMLDAAPFDDGGFSPDGRDRPPPIATAYDWRARHWACGWVEYLMVPARAPAALWIAAAEILQALAAYPILDEDAYSEKEWMAAEKSWAGLPIRDRVALCREAGVSVFAARHDSIPADDSGFIFDRVRPD
jgi:hypothetical protein